MAVEAPARPLDATTCGTCASCAPAAPESEGRRALGATVWRGGAGEAGRGRVGGPSSLGVTSYSLNQPWRLPSPFIHVDVRCRWRGRSLTPTVSRNVLERSARVSGPCDDGMACREPCPGTLSIHTARNVLRTRSSLLAPKMAVVVSRRDRLQAWGAWMKPCNGPGMGSLGGR